MKPLKLMAFDEEDLKVISSCCQDAVLKVSDLDFQPGEKKFVLTLNRFAWENEEASQKGERRKSVLHFEHVGNVKLSGIDRNNQDQVLSLLAILFEENESPSGTVELVFSGDWAIRLNVECIEAQLSDVAGAWEAQSRPKHEGV